MKQPGADMSCGHCNLRVRISRAFSFSPLRWCLPAVSHIATVFSFISFLSSAMIRLSDLTQTNTLSSVWEDDGWPAVAAQARSDGRHDRGGSVRLPSRQPSPPTLLSAGGDTSNFASCSLGMLKNKRAPAPSRSSCSLEGLSTSFPLIVPPPYLL